MKKTCIIIPTYNQEESTIRCFDSVSKNTENYKIIWVDNGSDKKSVDKVKNFLDNESVPYKLIRNEKNLGFIKATNQGIKESLVSDCDYVVFMNNDIEVYSEWLDRIIKIANKDKKNGIIGPISSNGTWMQSIDYLPKQYPDIFSSIPKYKNNPEIYSNIVKNKYQGVTREIFSHVAFFCTLLKRETVEDVGYLSEELGMGYFDDNDYCERALRKGWKIFICADVFVLHSHGKTFKNKFSHDEKMKIYNKNKKIFEKKFNKGGYDKPIDEIDDIGELRLEVKRLKESVKKEKFNYRKLLRLTGGKLKNNTRENILIRIFRFWKLKKLYIKYKNKIFFGLLSPRKFLKKYFKI